MVKTLKDLINLAKDKEKKILSVAVAQDREVLISVIEAVKLGIIDAILVGDTDKIEFIAKEESLNINNIKII
ncbi:phosphate acetyl/butyryl transferase, partial [Clostridium botulinum A1 str. CFSAN002368]